MGPVPEETVRANTALSQMDSSLLETDPQRAREELFGAPDAIRPGFQRAWAVPDVLAGNAQGPACQYTRKDAREK